MFFGQLGNAKAGNDPNSNTTTSTNAAPNRDHMGPFHRMTTSSTSPNHGPRRSYCQNDGGAQTEAPQGLRERFLPHLPPSRHLAHFCLDTNTRGYLTSDNEGDAT